MYIQYNMQGFVFSSNALTQQQELQQQREQTGMRLGQHSYFTKDSRGSALKSSPSPPPHKEEEVYRIRGKFPYVRYFSFTVYDASLQSISTLHDTDIRPSLGKNPFNDIEVTEDNMGTYEIYISKDGSKGYPNEMAALRPGSTSLYALLAFRLQLLDPRAGEDRSGSNREWGYVEMPLVEILNHRNGGWDIIRRCSDEFQARTEEFIENLDLRFNTWWPKNLQIGTECNATEFSLFDPEQNPIIRRGVAVRNANENYIFWCMPKEIGKKDYIIRITGKLPRTPYGLFDDIRVADTARYDSRYVSFTSADAIPLYPSYETIHDRDIFNHYSTDPFGSDWDRMYNLVATSNVDLAKKCGLYNRAEDVLLQLTRSPTFTHLPHVPAIVMRHLLPGGGTERRGTEGVANVNLRNECESPTGKLLCDPARSAKVLLQEFYPLVQIWTCDYQNLKPARLH